ncbi:MAG: alanine--glyoxylate aminotransferase family protein [Elusimicrobiota bacterium]
MKEVMYSLLTPGPTPVPDEILEELGRPILHHRTPEFGKILNSVFENLAYVFQTKAAEVFVLCSSGTGAMEAAVVNFFSPGDKVLVASIGAFGERWAAIAKAYGLEVVHFKQEWGRALDPDQLLGVFRRESKIAGVFITHVDTSTATLNPLREISRTLKDREALLLVDAVSSLAGEELRQDDWDLDVVVSGSQKGLMCPPGIAFLSVSPRALDRMSRAGLPRYYWDLRFYRESKKIPETPFTPPVSLLTGLAKALSIIVKDTMEVRWAHYKDLADWTRGAVGERLGCSIYSRNPSNVLTACRPAQEFFDGGFVTSKVLKRLRDENKITIADGQGDLKGKIFRIAHMGAITKKNIEAGIEALANLCRPAVPAISHGHRPV